MLVVLDTTETFNDLRLESPDYKMLHSFLARHPAKLVMPRIVVEEMTNHYRKKLTEQQKLARDKCRGLNALRPGTVDETQFDLDIAAACADYRQDLKRKLTKFFVEEVDYSDIDLPSVVARALERRKPFDSKGKAGFRDALLWESILIVAKRQKDDVVFVTRNSKDFGEHGRLADDLAADLKRAGISGEKVALCKGLRKFVDEYVKPSLDKLDQIQEEIQEGRYKHFDPGEFYRNFKEVITDEVRDYVRREDCGQLRRRIIGDYHSFDLHRLEDAVFDHEAVDVWNIDDDRMAVGINFVINGEIECMMGRDEWYRHGDEFVSEPYDEEIVGVASLTVIMTVILKKDDGEVEDWEINELEIDLGDAWPSD